MNIGKRWTLALIVVGSATGGALGANLLGSSPSSAANNDTTSTTSSTGSFHSNEGTAHEAGESAQRESDENAGKFPGRGTGPFHPNENSSHESSESAQRESNEDAGKFPTGP